MATSQLNSAEPSLQIAVPAESQAIARILVAVTAEGHSDSTVRFAARLARQLHAELSLLHVFSTGYSTGPNIVFSELEQRACCMKDATTLLEGIKLRLMPDLNVEMIVREGQPSAEIVKAAGDCDADLIVIGTPAHGWLTRTVRGSVTHSVVHHAPCPVLTVPLRWPTKS